MDKFKSMIESINHSTESFGVKAIDIGHLPFFFQWIFIILWMDIYQKQIGAFRIDPSEFGIGEVYSYLHVISIIVCVFFFKGKQYMRFSSYAAFALFSGFAFYYINPKGIITDILLLAAAIGLGFIFSSSCYFFSVALNNHEKFYAMVIGFTLSHFVTIIKDFVLESPLLLTIVSGIIPIVILISLFICTLFFRKAYSPSFELVNESVPGGIYFLLFIVAVVTSFSEDIAYAIIRASNVSIEAGTVELFSVGAFVGVFLLIVIQRVFKRNILYVWNLAFSFLVLGFVVFVLSRQENSYEMISVILLGGSYSVAYINMFFLMGLVVKKYRSLKFMKAAIIMGAASSIISYPISRVIMSSNFNALSNVFVIVGIIIILLFFLVSPRFVNELYDAEWAEDLHRIDVTYDGKLTKRLKDFKLSPKEIEVCQLLLQGYTMRQVSAIMSIAYSTVNTYCTSIYRKLSINSRTELIILLKEYTDDTRGSHKMHNNLTV